MAGSRPLTPREERLLVRHIRRLNARDRALISAQIFLGFRLGETLALTIGDVWVGEALREAVAPPPPLRGSAGEAGATRAVPVGPELRRAFEGLLRGRAAGAPLQPDEPLFLSPRCGAAGKPQAICRSMAQKIIQRALAAIVRDPQGLSSRSLRKGWGLRLYAASGHDLLLVRDALGHRSVAATQKYLPTNAGRMAACMLAMDWTRPGGSQWRAKPVRSEFRRAS